MATTSTTARFIAVLAVGAASLVLAGCSLLPGGNGGSNGGDTGTDEGDDVFSIEVGDCLNDANVSEEVSNVPIVDCAEAHDSEAYFAQDVEDGDFPGTDSIESSAEEICAPQFTTFVGIAEADSVYNYSYYYPTEQSWGAGDREILCVAYSDDLSQITGSIKGLAK